MSVLSKIAGKSLIPSFFKPNVAKPLVEISKTLPLVIAADPIINSTRKTVVQMDNPRNAMLEKVEKARMEKLASVFHLQLAGPDLGKVLPEPFINETFTLHVGNKDPEMGPFLKGVVELGKKIHRLSQIEQPPFGSLDSIRHEMSDLMGMPAYQKKIDTDHPAVNFLQLLSVKLHCADGEPILAEQARIGAPMSSPLRSMGDLAVFLRSRLKERTSFTFDRNSTIQKVWWSLFHPERAYHSFQSESNPLGYNPNKGNPSYLGPRFHLPDGRTMQAYYGPTPTGDRIFEYGLLPAYRKLGLSEIYFNYQDANHEPERLRIEEIQKIASKSENQHSLKHAVIGFDAKLKHPAIKELIKNFQTADEFLARYETHLNANIRSLDRGMGFSISPELLTDTQLKGIFSTAAAFYKEQQLDAKFTKPEIAQIIVMDIDARIAASILYQSLKSSNPLHHPGRDPDLSHPFISARCKQHIDRGAVQSNTLRLYFRLFEDDSLLNQKEFDEIAGGILGRSFNVEDRNILLPRYQRFDLLMQFIQDNHTVLAASLRTYRDAYIKTRR